MTEHEQHKVPEGFNSKELLNKIAYEQFDNAHKITHDYLRSLGVEGRIDVSFEHDPEQQTDTIHIQGEQINTAVSFSYKSAQE